MKTMIILAAAAALLVTVFALAEHPGTRSADKLEPTSAQTRAGRTGCYPGCMMGGGNFQLKLTLPATELEKICAKYSPIAAHCLTSGCTGNRVDSPPTPSFYTGDTKDHAFPDSFVVLVLVAESMGEEPCPWNHGQSCGLSVDRSRCQVVYWAEWW